MNIAFRALHSGFEVYKDVTSKLPMLLRLALYKRIAFVYNKLWSP